MRIERILCPTDLTVESETALRYASTLARAYEAQLILMYCQPDSPDKSDATVPSNAAELLDGKWAKIFAEVIPAAQRHVG